MDILGGDTPQQSVTQPLRQVQSIQNIDLLGGESIVKPPVISQQAPLTYQETHILEPQPNVINPSIFNFFDNNKVEQPTFQNIVIPVVEVLSGSDTSREGKYMGLTIRAAFEREGPNVYLVMDLENNSGVVLTVIFVSI